MINHSAVFLDAGSMGDDLPLTCLNELLPNLVCYPHTSVEDVGQRIADAQIIIVNKVKLGEAQFDEAKNLKLIVLTATGSDNIDIAAAARKGITVCNVKGYSVYSVPQHALTLMLMLATRVHQYTEDVSRGHWSKANHFSLLNHPITELKDKSLAIVGYGTLGQQLEQLVKPFAMRILLCNIPGRPEQNGRIDFQQALVDADFVSLHCPLTAQTQSMIGESEFKRMKSTACLINTARGQLVDEQALASALKSGQIAGAGIDVLSQEPPPLDHPLLDHEIPNLILTPHNAWGSIESRQELLKGVVANITHFVEGQPVNVLKPPCN